MIQMWIDAGDRPSICWQVLAYALLTSAEVMVSITCLEFSYTRAPVKKVDHRSSLLSVSVGNELLQS
ncbi:MAG: hypothetical protein R3B91_13330 [Planctomycetaceae bacterium]